MSITRLDLVRLRSALREWRWGRAMGGRKVAAHELADSVDLVLAAPTVWWCRMVGDVSSWAGCNAHASAESADHGCGWVALVPVVGGQDAS